MNDFTALPERPLPLRVSVDLQDHLMAACNDLDRLQGLLADACGVLLDSFRGAAEQLTEHRGAGIDVAHAAVVERVQQRLGQAVIALQFQDMTSQLIHHTHARLRSCADRLARDALVGDRDGAAYVEPTALRPNSVTQAEMDAGSIELF